MARVTASGADRLLLDTHVLLWWLANGAELAGDALDAIARAATVFVSTASVWEMSLKASLGKLRVPEDLPHELERHRFSVLPVHLDHALEVGSLPSLHRDPFDRMLVAQARVEGVAIVTRDASIQRYGVQVVQA